MCLKRQDDGPIVLPRRSPASILISPSFGALPLMVTPLRRRGQRALPRWRRLLVVPHVSMA